MLILEIGRGLPDERWPLYGIFEWDQARALRSFGHQVVYAAADLRSIRRRRPLGLTVSEKDGLPVIVCSLPVGALPGVDRAAGRAAVRAILRKFEKTWGRPDLVHIHFGDVAVYASAVCRELGLPYIVTEHSSKVNRDEIPEPQLRRLRECYGAAEAVIAVSGALKRRIERNTGVCAQVVPNILAFPRVDPGVQKEENAPLRLLAASSLLPVKGFDVLLRAFALFRADHGEAELCLMGDGPERKALERLIGQLGLRDCVRMSGAYAREDFAAALRRSDIYVFASRSETFGVVCAEALSCGVPVAATRCGGPEDFVNESNGLLAPIDDPEALAACIRGLAEHLGDYDRAAIAADTWRRFSPEAVSARLTAIMEAALREQEQKE